MTRDGDEYKSKWQRVDFANDKHQQGECDIFVSVHNNAASDGEGGQDHDANGIETFYSSEPKGDYGLASDVHSKAKDAYFGSTLGKFKDNDKTQKDFTVLKYTDMPACLVDRSGLHLQHRSRLRHPVQRVAQGGDRVPHLSRHPVLLVGVLA